VLPHQVNEEDIDEFWGQFVGAPAWLDKSHPLWRTRRNVGGDGGIPALGRSVGDWNSWLYGLAFSVASALEFYVNENGSRRAKSKRRGNVAGLPWAERVPPGTTTFDVSAGRAVVILDDPFRDFGLAVRDAEVSRIRQCAICDRFFYAVRLDQKACSRRCNHIRHTRAWRKKKDQYKYSRYQNEERKTADSHPTSIL
jgi:hypothetical protein